MVTPSEVSGVSRWRHLVDNGGSRSTARANGQTTIIVETATNKVFHVVYDMG